MRFLIRALVILALPAGASAFADDLTIVSKVTRDGGSPETAVSYISSDHVRTQHGDGRETLFDLKTGQMTTLDARKKTYSVVTREELDDASARLQEQLNSPDVKQAQEAMKDLPPEDRKRMEAAMGGMFAADVQKTGTTRKIAGYNCENWTVSIGQLSRSEECLTTELHLPAQSWEAYRKYADTLRSLMSSMGMAGNQAKMFEQFKKMRGYPLANTTTVEVMGTKTVTTSEVVEIKRGPIPASAWEIPAGYTKVDNPLVRGAGGRRKR